MSEYGRNATNSEAGSAKPVGREEVIEAAIRAGADLFSENNPSQVSVREIARRAGVSHALVHRYLGGKDDIFRAVVASESKKAREAWAGVDDLTAAPSVFDEGYTPDRLLRILLRAHMEGIKVDPQLTDGPLSHNVLKVLEEHPVTVSADEPGFDPRLVLLATTAAMASLSLAHDFFITSAELKGMDRETFHAEFHRLMLHILSLADTSK